MHLSEKDRDMLLKTLDSKNPELLQARMANALLLLADGLSSEDVAGLLFIEEQTVSTWEKIYARRHAA